MISFLFKNNEMKYNCISHICTLLFFCKLDLSSINWELQLRLRSIIMIFHQHLTNHYVRLSHQNSSEIKEQFMASIFLTNTIEIQFEWKFWGSAFCNLLASQFVLLRFFVFEFQSSFFVASTNSYIRGPSRVCVQAGSALYHGIHIRDVIMGKI